jgi:branched-chain amino acid transport system substrate-binding protein
VEFRLLGLLEVVGDAGPVQIVRGRESQLLALLLLHRNEPLSADEIVDELWADQAPENARQSVRIYISRLRKALGSDRIETTAAGYRILVAEGELDLDGVEALARQGEPHKALALWRGEPLAEFRFDSFAQTAIRQLEELKNGLVAEQLDGDIAAGRATETIPRLEAMIDREPLWERPRGQLMRALYLAGRQADALALYRQTRDTFADELGVDPTPELQQLERAILNHDPALGAPARRPLSPAARRRSGLLLLVGALLLVAAAAAAAIVQLTRDGDARVVTVAGSSLAAIDPKTGRVVADYPVGNTPSVVSIGQGAAWVLNADDRTVSRVDPATGSVKTFATGATPIALAAGNGGVWVGNGVRRPDTVLPVLTSVSSLDPARVGSVLRTVRLPIWDPYLPGIVVGDRTVWAISQNNDVFRIDPQGRRDVPRRIRVPGQTIGLALAPGGSVWAVTLDGHVFRIDPRANRITFRLRLAASGLSSLAVGAGAVWASDPYDGTVWRIDPGTPTVTRTISVPTGTSQLAFGAGSLWAVDAVGGNVLQINPRTNRVTRTITVGNTPRAIAVGVGVVWVSVAGGAQSLAAAVHSHPSSRIALPQTSCGDVIYGGDSSPQYLIASDFPLHVGPQASTLAMSQTVEYVLRQHHFRAGKYQVAFQSCDDSTAQSGNYDPVKCAGNAKLMAADTHVLGVVGPFNSTCAQQEIPITNQVSLAVVSPSTSASALTRTLPGANGNLSALYPTRRRNFFRVYPADDSQAAALALLAKQLGAHRIYVLRGGSEEYVNDIAPWVVPAAHRLGLGIAGTTTWDPGANNAEAVAAKVKRSGADAVYLAGLLFDGRMAGQIITDLRNKLGPRTPLIAGDGFLPISGLFRAAGPAARGIFVSSIGLPADRLPAEGRRFLKEFTATQPSGRIDPTTAYWVAYTAAATTVLLDAIARSDGTRESVRTALASTDLKTGIVGPIAFDRNGDTTTRPITIYRAEHPSSSIQFGAVQGATLDRVINVPATLVR